MGSRKRESAIITKPADCGQYRQAAGVVAQVINRVTGSGRRKRPLSFQHFKPHTDVADYRKNAEKCRELAKLRARTEHWPAFLEMAQTWEKLADLHELSQRLKSSGVLLEKPALLGPAQDAEDASGRVS